MKQIIPFVKDLGFETKISEITSIALEHNLQLENNDSIVGNFIVSGKYKINDVSINEESFEQNIPFDITLVDKYDASKLKIDIDDFYYEIINDKYLRVHIDVLADNLVYYKVKNEEVKKEELVKDNNNDIKGDLRNENGEYKEENNSEIKNVSETMKNDIDVITEKNNQEIDARDSKKIINMPKEDAEVNKQEVNEISNLQSGFLSEKESYSTYKIHIVRENDTIETIKEKYNISSEELEKYNSLDKIVLGTKIIIPVLDE